MVVFDGHEYLTAEEKRLKEDRDRVKYWKKWGPYVAERQWATGRPFPFCTVSSARLDTNLFDNQCVRITVPTVMLGAVSATLQKVAYPVLLILNLLWYNRFHSRPCPISSFPMGRGRYCWRFRHSWPAKRCICFLERGRVRASATRHPC